MVYGLINTDLLVIFLQTGKDSDHLVPLSTRNTQCSGISYKFRRDNIIIPRSNKFFFASSNQSDKHTKWLALCQ